MQPMIYCSKHIAVRFDLAEREISKVRLRFTKRKQWSIFQVPDADIFSLTYLLMMMTQMMNKRSQTTTPATMRTHISLKIPPMGSDSESSTEVNLICTGLEGSPTTFPAIAAT